MEYQQLRLSGDFSVSLFMLSATEKAERNNNAPDLATHLQRAGQCENIWSLVSAPFKN